VKHLFVQRFRRTAGSQHCDTLVAFIASRTLDPGAVASELEKEVDVRLIPDQLIFVCRESVADDVVRAFRATGPFRRLRERLLERTPTTLISFGSLGIETRRQLLSEGEHPSDLAFEEILRRGGTAIFERNNGFVQSTSTYHFRSPSGRHTSRFMRLSNILVRQTEISFVALCAMRFVPEGTKTVYVDTPSLFGVVAAMNDFRSSEGGLAPVSADSYRSYDHVKTYKYFRTVDSIALVSASSSGNLALRLQERGFKPDAIVHILFLGVRTPALIAGVDLTRDSEENPDGYQPTREDNKDTDCSLCRSGSIPVALQGDQFDIAGPQPDPLVITRTAAHAALRETMARHAGTGVFRVNGGRPARHYAIDPERVAADGTALKRLQYMAAARVPARLGHCVAANEGSVEFARRLHAAAGSDARIFLPNEFDDLVTEAAEGFEHPILVVSAVVGSGRQLLDISRRLRSCPKAPLIYFAGIMATPSAAHTKTLERSLALTSNAAAHALYFIDELNLPPADAPNPWDRELTLFDSIVNSGGTLSTGLDRRRERLRKVSVPLQTELFLTNTPTAALKLQAGFAFWDEAVVARPHSQADVYYTMGAVLQGLRTAEPTAALKTLRTEWFYRTLLSPENFGRFNDAVIQASLLRAARPSELDFTDNRAASRDAARMIRRIVESARTPRGEAAAEFLIALATGHLRLAKEDLGTVFDGLSSQTAVVDELASICTSQLR